MYEDYICYGPYIRKDGRQHIVLIKHNEKGQIIDRKTVSYPKYLVENYLNKNLKKDETIDHIDGDISNNDLSNLRIVSRQNHCKSHCLQRIQIERICPFCGEKYYSFNNKTCGKMSCRGKCSHLSMDKPETLKQSLRSTIEEIQSVNGG